MRGSKWGLRIGGLGGEIRTGMIPKTTPDLTEENNKPLIFDIGIQPCTTTICDDIHD